jgi:hypothetical protein
MAKWLSRPGDEKYIDKKCEMWARYQEIQNKKEDDRYHLAPGETITTAGSQHVAVLASRKIVAGTGDTYSSDSSAPVPVAAKR